MPNTKSAAKAMRQAERRRVNNLKTKSKFKAAVKKVKKLVSETNASEAATALKDAMSAMDKAVKKGVMHKNTASRKKSRLAKSIGKLAKK
jgi:small subunit ribosomal protein S20